MVGADGQTERHGLFAVRNLPAAVLVHKGNVPQSPVAVLSLGKSLGDLIPLDVRIKQHGYVVVGHRVLRKMRERVGA